MRKFLLLSLLMLVFGSASVSAQSEDSDSPLLEMLARIPVQSGANEWLTYIDYHAVVAARPGAPQIHSLEEAGPLLESDSEERSLFTSALMSYQSGPAEVPQSLMLADEAIDAIGIDLYAVERAIQYANPPASVTILEGDFDNEAISSAFAARDYTQTEEDGLTLLCGEAGCDSGMRQDLANRNPANIFGGQLGRSQPVLLGDEWLASSPSDVALNGVTEAVSGERETLADVPAYRLAAEALSAKGTVLQAYFINPAQIGSSLMDILLASSRLTQEQIEAIRERLATDFEPLLPYSLVVLAQVAAEDEDLTVVALVYPDAETAEAAGEILLERIENYTSFAVQRPLNEMLEERGVTSMDTEVVEGDERATLLLTLHAPLPGTEVPDDAPTPRSLGLVYAIFVRAYQQRDLGWLATVFD